MTDEITPKKIVTIDQYGIDASIRYATDQALYNKDLIKDSKTVPNASQTTVSSPTYPETDTIFGLENRNASWGFFAPPPENPSKDKPPFSSQFIPSLGSTEQQEETLLKIQNINLPSKSSSQDIKKAEKERKIMHSFATETIALTKNFDDIKNFLNLFMKG